MLALVYILNAIVVCINFVLAQVSLWVVALGLTKGVAFLCAVALVGVSIAGMVVESSKIRWVTFAIQAAVSLLLMVKFFTSNIESLKTTKLANSPKALYDRAQALKFNNVSRGFGRNGIYRKNFTPPRNDFVAQRF